MRAKVQGLIGANDPDQTDIEEAVRRKQLKDQSEQSSEKKATETHEEEGKLADLT